MALVLLVLALICEVIAMLLGFAIFGGSHVLGWVALGLVFWIGAVIVGAAPIPTLRRGE